MKININGDGKSQRSAFQSIVSSAAVVEMLRNSVIQNL